MLVSCFEKQYLEKGIYAQRQYPTDALLCFLGGEGCLSGRDNKSIKILEIGCGSGANLWMLAKEGFDVYGIDNSVTSLKLAKEHLNNKWNVDADICVGSFDRIPYDDNMFDYVIDIVSMQHIDLKTSKDALKEVYRVLKPKGKFFSYRLSDHSVMYENDECERIDAATISNIPKGLPLAGNGTTSFWSPSLARYIYGETGLKVESIERRARCYARGVYNVEYLAIIGVK